MIVPVFITNQVPWIKGSKAYLVVDNEGNQYITYSFHPCLFKIVMENGNWFKLKESPFGNGYVKNISCRNYNGKRDKIIAEYTY